MKNTLRWAIIAGLCGVCFGTVPGLAADVSPAMEKSRLAAIQMVPQKQPPPLTKIGEKAPLMVTEFNTGKAVRLTAGDKPAAVLCFISLNRPEVLEKQVRHMEGIYTKYHDKMNFYSLATKGTNKEFVQQYINSYGISYPIVTGDGLAYTRIFPTIVLIDAQGYLRNRVSGEIAAVELDQLTKAVIEEPLPADAAQRQQDLDKEMADIRQKRMELVTFPTLLRVEDPMYFMVVGRQLLADSPTEPIRKAYVEILNGNYAEGIRQYSKAIEAEPRDGRLYLLRSTAYTALGKRDLADKDIQQAYVLNPDDGHIMRAVYENNLRNGRLADAAKQRELFLQKAKHTYPRAIVFQAAQLYILGGQADKGLACYKNFLTKDDNPIRGNVDYGLLLSCAGRYAEANTYFDQSLQLLQKSIGLHQAFVSSLYKEKAWNEWKLQEHSAALMDIQKAIALRPRKKTDWYALKAVIERDMGLLQAAEQDEQIAYHYKADSHSE